MPVWLIAFRFCPSVASESPVPAFSASPSSLGRIGRRGLLQAGLLSAGGLNLSNLLRLEAAQETTARRPKSVIFLFLHGGPSQLETYDLKPHATSDSIPRRSTSSSRLGAAPS